MANGTYITTISYNMVIDMLQPNEIISEPAHPPKGFKWVSSVHWEKGIVPEKDMLFVCKGKAAEQASKLHPSSCLIVIAEEDASEATPDIPNQAIVIRGTSRSANLLQRLQNYFLSIQAWQNELDRIPLSSDGYEQVLHKSGKVLGVPLLLYNADLVPLARSWFNANLPLCKMFAEREKEILNSVLMLRRPLISFKGTASNVFVANELIRNKNKDLYHVLALYEKEPTPGQRDLFAMLVKKIAEKSDRQTGSYSPARFSAYSLFDELIQGRYVAKGLLNDYAYNIGFPLDAEFRLLRFVSENPEADDGLPSLLNEAKHMNDGKCLPVVYNDDLLVLLYSKGLDNILSNSIIEEELLRCCGPIKGYVAMSQVFDDISNLLFAYQQTNLVIKYKEFVNLEQRFTTADKELQAPCYTFEEVLKFAILDSSDMNQELKDFSFSHTILEKIIAEDIATGGDDARILASYIHHERKATAVAEKLHMHRNTVLYRIDKIEKRFGLNFDESWSRDRVLFDFSILYCKLMRNPELYREILGQDTP